MTDRKIFCKSGPWLASHIVSYRILACYSLNYAAVRSGFDEGVQFSCECEQALTYRRQG